MNQEVIQDFLNVPGITGIALFSRQSEPVFYSSHPEIFQGRSQLLAEGILQVVETIPTEYEVLEFQCAQTQVVLHRLPQDMILLVLKDQSYITDQFTHVVEACDRALPSSRSLLNPLQMILPVQPYKTCWMPLIN
ncbi:hypothetical protein [Leptolyngbya sp. FACHB-17]|uniref:hypothetical protein n=1 Tax=unclassified Leptolyngbya TaxID=2650499 RepID=UPI00168122B2|nr:hypothetical protein [Leptolyngbya sp. FACHB-17]MBD2083251.1 hypothetical protein [Leptolyngbya sp. FACHB-17]